MDSVNNTPPSRLAARRQKVLKLNELVNQTVLISSQSGKAGRNKRDLEVTLVAQVTRATPESDEARRIVSGLALSKPNIAEEFAARLHLCEVAVAYARQNQLGKSPHIVVGQIVYRGRQTPRAVAFQSQVMEEGFFVTVWSEPDKEAQIALHGYKPRLIKSKEGTAVVNLGTIELTAAMPAELASVAFSLPADVEAVDANKDISLRVRPTLVTAWGELAHTDTNLNIPVRKIKNMYMATGLTPGLLYSLEVKAKNARLLADFVLEPKEKRESVVWEKSSARQSKVEIADPAFERALSNAKSQAKYFGEMRRRKLTIITGRLRMEDSNAELPIGRMTSNFTVIPGGRMVGVIDDRAKPFYFRTAGYREKQVQLTSEQRALSEDEPIEIGNVVFEKLPASESATIRGQVQWRPSVPDPPTLDEQNLQCELQWYDNRNSGWGNGQTASIPMTLDAELKFSVQDLLPGAYIVSVTGKGVASSFHNYVNVSQGRNETPITILVEWPKQAQIEWIVRQDDGLHMSRKRTGQIFSEEEWWAVPSEKDSQSTNPDLYCLVAEGKMELWSHNGPMYFKDLGKGELEDFLASTPEMAREQQKIPMIPGHVYLIRHESPAPVFLMRVIDVKDTKAPL